jgi:hypothetical protein
VALGICAYSGFALAIGFIIFWVNRLYRCPSCDEVPMGGNFYAGASGFGYEEGVLFNPKICPRCGVRLGR